LVDPPAAEFAGNCAASRILDVTVLLIEWVDGAREYCPSRRTPAAGQKSGDRMTDHCYPDTVRRNLGRGAFDEFSRSRGHSRFARREEAPHNLLPAGLAEASW